MDGRAGQRVQGAQSSPGCCSQGSTRRAPRAAAFVQNILVADRVLVHCQHPHENLDRGSAVTLLLVCTGPKQ